MDQAVAIDEVKKFIAEQDLNAETRDIPPVVTTQRTEAASRKKSPSSAPARPACPARIIWPSDGYQAHGI